MQCSATRPLLLACLLLPAVSQLSSAQSKAPVKPTDTAKIPPALAQPLLPRIWTASNDEFLLPGITVTTTAQQITTLEIWKVSPTSLLKVGFSGGNMSFVPDADGEGILHNAQVVLAIWVDGQVVSESLNHDAQEAFRNQCPSIATVIRKLKAGHHTIAVCISKTSNPGELGSATYFTDAGNTPNTYEANLTVEEWQTP